MSSEQKVVQVTYNLTDYFKIPKGLDLQNDLQVKGWTVKYNRLSILKTDDTTIEIEPIGYSFDYDYKYPDDILILSREDVGIDDSDEEENNITNENKENC